MFVEDSSSFLFEFANEINENFFLFWFDMLNFLLQFFKLGMLAFPVPLVSIHVVVIVGRLQKFTFL